MKFIYTTKALDTNQHLVRIDNKRLSEVYCQGYENGKRKKDLDGWYFKKEVSIKPNNLSQNLEIIEISQQVLNFINTKTERETLEEQSTKQVAAKFSITSKEAYKILCGLAKKGLIEKLAPVNGDNFDCCGWIRLTDEL